MTEEEAKTKWCPFGRVEGPFVYGNPTVNRGEAEKSWTFCIASACMAWRGPGYCGLAGAIDFAYPVPENQTRKDVS